MVSEVLPKLGDKDMKTFNKKQFWMSHCMDFNFELDENQLLKKALLRKFIVKIGKDLYTYA